MLPCVFIVECRITHFLCAMHVFEVRASSSSYGYLCAKFCFFVTTCFAELAHGEQMHTQSINDSLSSFDAPGTEAFASEFCT